MKIPLHCWRHNLPLWDCVECDKLIKVSLTPMELRAKFDKIIEAARKDIELAYKKGHDDAVECRAREETIDSPNLDLALSEIKSK